MIMLRFVSVIAFGITLAVLPGAAGPAGAIGIDSTTAESAALTQAQAAVKAGRYRDAIKSLERVVADDPRNADAFNYLGYAHRKLGEFGPALSYYERALVLDPNHRGAHEYLGELYLQVNNLAKAEERVAVLARICFLGCEELDELRAAVAAHKQRGG